ncbi:MAG TPA: kanamycin nucleotidyltransferase C-terminal domain-containing protein [bacterium]|jgi:kanamycin nucleotidyltransferase|nr:kanamycin nucleotidyltransferase C-terminal domain-containing protein [bacterium]
MTHEERLAIARGLAARIVEEYGEAVLAVFVTSSTAKGLDRPHSDLELTAVLRDGVEVEGKSYVYEGILIEIDYDQESALLRAARRVSGRWAQEADGFRSRIVLFEREGWTARLDEAVAEADAADIGPALAKAATMIVENRDKLRNARYSADAMDVRVAAFWVAEGAANLVLLLNRRYMITTSRFYVQAFECPEQPPDFRARMEKLMGLAPAGEAQLAAIADALTADLLAMVATRGVSVESETLIV